MSQISEWLHQARDWLDARGKPAWIAAMVVSFILFWPIGLFLLFYMIGSNRMFSCKKRRHRHARFQSTGNVAFDSYRDETLKRLEEEQGAFQSFLDRLRQAKDKAEFDQFMNEQKSGNTPAADPA